MKEYIKLARPKHWIKNAVVLFPVIFGLKLDDLSAWLAALAAAGVFCLASSAIYALNDIIDAENDRLHPEKKNRPVASGALSSRAALIEVFILTAMVAVLCLFLDILVSATVIVYLLLQLSYVFIFKHHVLVDVIAISLGFVLRAVAGAVAIKVVISPWLFICMFTIFLFMGFCKRYNELVVLGENFEPHKHRKTLIAYTPELLTHLITTSAGIAIVSFLSYSLSATTLESFGTNYFVYTLPLMVYAVFRFAMLSMQGNHLGPTDIITKDRPFQLATFLWIVCIVLLILYGNELSKFLNYPV